VNLLQPHALEGYPADYLLARLRGRRGADHHPRPEEAALADAERWQGLLREVSWLYRQMEEGLRQTLVPALSALELRTLLLCLRLRNAPGFERGERLLAASLLDEALKAALRRETSLPAAVLNISHALAKTHPACRGMERAFAGGDLAAFEQALTRLFLEQTLAKPLAPEVRQFLRRLVDLHNLLALYKFRRWQIPGRPGFIPGGNVPSRRLEDLHQAGIAEEAVLAWIGRELRRPGAGAPGPILDYLWHCYLRARGQGMIRARRDLERWGALEEA
jgi:hypothetical protein